MLLLIIIIRARRWKWLGHVVRMPTERNLKTALTCQPEGKRKRRGWPRETWRRISSEQGKRHAGVWNMERGRANSEG